MLTPAERRTLKSNLVKYENNIAHMYLDSNGEVTVGVGHLLPTVQDAQKLPFVDSRNIKASPGAIQQDFDSVNKQMKAMKASFYKKYTKLTLGSMEIDRLVEKHIDSFYQELKILYPEFDKYPGEAKLALFDMIFNVGMTRLRARFPSLNTSVKAKDWKKAAVESHRAPPISADRNKYVKDLFEKAAKKP